MIGARNNPKPRAVCKCGDRLIPLGIEPKEVHRAKRLIELGKAIKRYEDTGVEVPSEWIEEHRDLVWKYGYCISKYT